MANWTALSNAIRQVIYSNGTRDITGQVLQTALLNIVNNLGSLPTFGGTATPSTNPGVHDGPVFYIATAEGTYSNFNNITVAKAEVPSILICTNSAWTKQVIGTSVAADISAIESAIATEVSRAQAKDAELEDAVEEINKIVPSLEEVKSLNSQFEKQIISYSLNYPVEGSTMYTKFASSTFSGVGFSIGGSNIPVNGLEIYIKVADWTQTQQLLSKIRVAICKNDSNGDEVVNQLLNTDRNYTAADGMQLIRVYFAEPVDISECEYYYLSIKCDCICTPFIAQTSNPSQLLGSRYYLKGEVGEDVNTGTAVSSSYNNIYFRFIGELSVELSDSNIENISSRININWSALPNETVTPQKTTFFVAGKNFYDFENDSEKLLHGGYINSSNGQTATNYAQAGYTGFIALPEGHVDEYVVCNNAKVAGVVIGCACYNSSKQYTHGVQAKAIQILEGDAFVRFTLNDNVTGEVQVELGQTSTPYAPPSYVIDPKVLPEQKNENVEVVLPDRIYAVVGDTLQIFYRGVIQAVNPYNYNILVSCSKGKQFNRMFEYTPTNADVGTTSFSITVKNNNGDVLGTKTCQLVTASEPVSPSSMLHVCCFGDSLTASGVWPAEAYRRLTQTGGTPEGMSLSNIQFNGLKSASGAGYFGVGGWSWNSYTTNTLRAFRFMVSSAYTANYGAVYTDGNNNNFTMIENNSTNGNMLFSVDYGSTYEPVGNTLTKVSGTGAQVITFTSASLDSQNPLWDYANDKMTFIPYANNYCDGSIDVVYTLLSWNAQTPWRTDFSSVISEVKKFADTLHSEFPNAKLKILGLQVPDVNGGMGKSYGATGSLYADAYGNVVTALNQNKAYQEFANSSGYSSFVEFVNVSSQFDTEYLMPYTEEPVNSRSSVTEKRGMNGVHPSPDGYKAIGDIVYRNFVAKFCQQ